MDKKSKRFFLGCDKGFNKQPDCFLVDVNERRPLIFAFTFGENQLQNTITALLERMKTSADFFQNVIFFFNNIIFRSPLGNKCTYTSILDFYWS